MTRRPQVFGTGLISLDVAVASDRRMPTRVAAGGTCGNVLSILAFLGWASFPIARLNGDAAGDAVRADLHRWSVNLDYSGLVPPASTPMLVEKVSQGDDGHPRHRFSWSCPRCGAWLPSYRPVTLAATEDLGTALNAADVYFLDRLSPAALALAENASSKGALVVFEPSSRIEPRLVQRAMRVAHVLKYSTDRVKSVEGVVGPESAVLVEIQTLGSDGLRYRHRLGAKWSDWRSLRAIPAPSLVDSCGSGDWCTAGLVDAIGRQGAAGLRSAGASGVREGLRKGQAMAAWNCAFLGARGGMYERTRASFHREVAAIRAGQRPKTGRPARIEGADPIPACPSCPPSAR